MTGGTAIGCSGAVLCLAANTEIPAAICQAGCFENTGVGLGLDMGVTGLALLAEYSDCSRYAGRELGDRLSIEHLRQMIA